MCSTPTSPRSPRRRSENTSEPISRNNTSLFSELKNSSEEEELRDSASSMTTRTPWERSSPPPELRESSWRKSLPRTERRVPARRKEERPKRSRSTSCKERPLLSEDNRRTSKENKTERRNNFLGVWIILIHYHSTQI